MKNLWQEQSRRRRRRRNQTTETFRHQWLGSELVKKSQDPMSTPDGTNTLS